jgi:hypothetical protein
MSYEEQTYHTIQAAKIKFDVSDDLVSTTSLAFYLKSSIPNNLHRLDDSAT